MEAICRFPYMSSFERTELSFIYSGGCLKLRTVARTMLTTLLTILQMPERARRILFGLIVLFVTAAYLRIVEERWGMS